jgi:hypothetical protein
MPRAAALLLCLFIALVAGEVAAPAPFPQPERSNGHLPVLKRMLVLDRGVEEPVNLCASCAS